MEEAEEDDERLPNSRCSHPLHLSIHVRPDERLLLPLLPSRLRLASDDGVHVPPSHGSRRRRQLRGGRRWRPLRPSAVVAVPATGIRPVLLVPLRRCGHDGGHRRRELLRDRSFADARGSDVPGRHSAAVLHDVGRGQLRVVVVAAASLSVDDVGRLRDGAGRRRRRVAGIEYSDAEEEGDGTLGVRRRRNDRIRMIRGRGGRGSGVPDHLTPWKHVGLNGCRRMVRWLLSVVTTRLLIVHEVKRHNS